jgi:RNA polymerase sigma-70 factor (ECF subfamily)
MVSGRGERWIERALVGERSRRAERWVSDGSEPSDEALVAGMAVGDETAAVSFVRRYQRRVYGLALSMLADPGLAEDVAQEALVRAWRHAAVYDPRRAPVSAWVLTITRNLSIDALRLHRAVPLGPEEVSRLAGSDDMCDAAFDAVVALPRLRAALDALPREQRRALVLAVGFGYTAAEVAVTESVPLGTAKTRIRSGLSKLRASSSPEEPW